MNYEGNQKGRSYFSFIIQFLVGLLGAGFIWATISFKSVIAGGVSIILVFLSGSVIRSIVLKENWLSGIENNEFWWDSPRSKIIR